MKLSASFPLPPFDPWTRPPDRAVLVYSPQGPGQTMVLISQRIEPHDLPAGVDPISIPTPVAWYRLEITALADADHPLPRRHLAHGVIAHDGLYLVAVQHHAEGCYLMRPPVRYLPRNVGPNICWRQDILVEDRGCVAAREVLDASFGALEKREHPNFGPVEGLRLSLDFDNGPLGRDLMDLLVIAKGLVVALARLVETPHGSQESTHWLTAGDIDGVRFGEEETRRRLLIVAAQAPPAPCRPWHEADAWLRQLAPLRVGGPAIKGWALAGLTPGDPTVLRFQNGSQVVEWVAASHRDQEAPYAVVLPMEGGVLGLRGDGAPAEAVTLGRLLQKLLNRQV